jgi:hypothetical protein
MAQKPIEIDHRGFNNMVKELRKYSNIKTRPLIRGLTSDVLHAAAGRTRVGSVKAIERSLDKHFRQPHEVPGKGFVGITKKGKVWVSSVKWKDKAGDIKQKWVLISRDGKLRNAPKEITQNGRTIELSKQAKQDINAVIKSARAWRRQQLAYRKDRIGLSQASWLQLVRMLKLPVHKMKGISTKALSYKVPAAARAALHAYENIRGRDNFTVTISNAVQATLNNRRGESSSKKLDGMNAFRLAMNGQTQRFKTAARKDFQDYVKQFSERHGFNVK